MKIIITGCAGFIGYHISKKFLYNNCNVIGIDNLNSYYSKKLKNNRLKELKNNYINNFKFYEEDIKNYSSIKKIFNKHKPLAVIHLAAQAGVRYSIENPKAYIDTNIDGFFNIIEISRLFNIKTFFYASSSSVYGNNDNYPLNEKLNTDNPLSLYAASKKSNELIAKSYFNIFKFKSVGLRFFTVYGPFGRPDMIMYKIFESIYLKKKLLIYNNGNHFRDFTFVDDVSEYIYRLFYKFPKSKINSDIMNIGYGKSISLKKIIDFSEKVSQKKLNFKYVKMQIGDVIKTHSDISKIKKITNYKSNYDFKKGITLFHKWFINYHKI
tara:strand:- start:8538 stop:9509 length:972 start_codon:yes stop_codon:yes gene_type:complete